MRPLLGLFNAILGVPATIESASERERGCRYDSHIKIAALSESRPHNDKSRRTRLQEPR